MEKTTPPAESLELARELSMKPHQSEFDLPELADGVEILEVYGDDLAALEARLATEHRYIVVLEVVCGRQYQATIAPLPKSYHRVTTNADEARLGPGRQRTHTVGQGEASMSAATGKGRTV